MGIICSLNYCCQCCKADSAVGLSLNVFTLQFLIKRLLLCLNSWRVLGMLGFETGQTIGIQRINCKIKASESKSRRRLKQISDSFLKAQLGFVYAAQSSLLFFPKSHTVLPVRHFGIKNNAGEHCPLSIVHNCNERWSIVSYCILSCSEGNGQMGQMHWLCS